MRLAPRRRRAPVLPVLFPRGGFEIQRSVCCGRRARMSRARTLPARAHGRRAGEARRGGGGGQAAHRGVDGRGRRAHLGPPRGHAPPREPGGCAPRAAPPRPPNRHGAFFQAAVSSQIAVRNSDAPCPASRACRCACRQRSGAGAGGGALRADRCGRRRLALHAAAGRGHGGGRGGRQPYCQRWCGQRRRQGLRAGVPPRPGRGDTRGRQCRPEALARMARCCAGGRCRRTCPCVQRQ